MRGAFRIGFGMTFGILTAVPTFIVAAAFATDAALRVLGRVIGEDDSPA